MQAPISQGSTRLRGDHETHIAPMSHVLEGEGNFLLLGLQMGGRDTGREGASRSLQTLQKKKIKKEHRGCFVEYCFMLPFQGTVDVRGTCIITS